MLDYVHAHPILAKTPIVGHLPTACQNTCQLIMDAFQILYGQSIGGAVSIDLAYRNPQAVSNLLPSALLFSCALREA